MPKDYFKNWSIFKKIRKKEDLPIIMVLVDQLGLAEKSESIQLKEYTNKEEYMSFIKQKFIICSNN